MYMPHAKRIRNRNVMLHYATKINIIHVHSTYIMKSSQHFFYQKLIFAPPVLTEVIHWILMSKHHRLETTPYNIYWGYVHIVIKTYISTYTQYGLYMLETTPSDEIVICKSLSSSEPEVKVFLHRFSSYESYGRQKTDTTAAPEEELFMIFSIHHTTIAVVLVLTSSEFTYILLSSRCDFQLLKIILRNFRYSRAFICVFNAGEYVENEGNQQINDICT